MRDADAIMIDMAINSYAKNISEEIANAKVHLSSAAFGELIDKLICGLQKYRIEVLRGDSK